MYNNKEIGTMNFVLNFVDFKFDKADMYTTIRCFITYNSIEICYTREYSRIFQFIVCWKDYKNGKARFNA